MQFWKLQRLDQVKIEVRNVSDGIEPVRSVGAAETRMLRNDHVKTRSELLHERPPGARTAHAVQEEQRRAGARTHHADLAAVDGVEAFGRRHGLSFRTPRSGDSE